MLKRTLFAIFLLPPFLLSAQVPVKRKPAAKPKAKTVAPKGKVVLPQFPGGQDSLVAFLNRNMKYPQDAYEAGVSGTVKVRFRVGQDGRIMHVIILNHIHPSLEAEADRLMKLMPTWKPGERNGKKEAMDMYLPFDFQLVE